MRTTWTKRPPSCLSYLSPNVGVEAVAVRRRAAAGRRRLRGARRRTGRAHRAETARAAGRAAAGAARDADRRPLPAHVLEVVAKRSGGNPQFLRDLLRTAIESGGIADLPDSAEAAAMAQIDCCRRRTARSSAVPRCSALTFHPRMLAWFVDDGDAPPPSPSVWERLANCSTRSRTATCDSVDRCCATLRTRDLPYGLSAQAAWCGRGATRRGTGLPGEAAGILSLHYFEAGDYRARVALRDARGALARKPPMRTSKPPSCIRARCEAGRRLDAIIASGELARSRNALGRCVVSRGRIPQGVRRLHRCAAAARERSARRSAAC